MVLDVKTYAERPFANDYVTAYMADDAAWTGSTDDQKDAALRQATQWVDLAYGLRWDGRRSQTDQPRDWPRFHAMDRRTGCEVPPTEIPEAVRQATVEVAVRVRQGVPLMPDVDVSQVGVKRIQQRVEGAVEEEIEYSGSGAPASTATIMGKVERMLSHLLRDGGGSGRVVRGG